MEPIKKWRKFEHPLIKFLFLSSILIAITEILWAGFGSINPNFIWVLISPFIFWIFLIYGFSFLYKNINSKLKRGEKLTEKEAHNILTEKVPRYYPFLSVIRVSLFIILIIVLGVTLGFGFYTLQRSIFHFDGALLFLPTNLAMVLFMLSSIFIAIPLSSIILAPIIHKFPKFERYAQRRSIRFGDRQKFFYENEMKTILKIFFIISAIAIPIVILGMFNYVYIAENGLHVNKFLNFKENSYEWEDISRVSLELNSQDLRYYIFFNEGTKIDLFVMGIPKNFRDIENKIKSTGIQRDYNPEALEKMNYLISNKVYGRFV